MSSLVSDPEIAELLERRKTKLSGGCAKASAPDPERFLEELAEEFKEAGSDSESSNHSAQSSASAKASGSGLRAPVRPSFIGPATIGPAPRPAVWQRQAGPGGPCGSPGVPGALPPAGVPGALPPAGSYGPCARAAFRPGPYAGRPLNPARGPMQLGACGQGAAMNPHAGLQGCGSGAWLGNAGGCMGMGNAGGCMGGPYLNAFGFQMNPLEAKKQMELQQQQMALSMKRGGPNMMPSAVVMDEHQARKFQEALKKRPQ